MLLVEDDADVRTAVRRMLEAGGYRVVEAEHGTAALAVAARRPERLDVVLTDVMMPETGAGALLPRLRGLRPTTPVLLMSGCDRDAVARVAGTGDPEFLLKPFTARELLRRVHAALARPLGTG